MNTILLIISQFILTTQLFSQTTYLYGQVIDLNDQHPIDFAGVQLSSSRSTFSTLTDENGKFSFTNIPIDSIRITVEHLGYNGIDTNLYLNNVDSNWVTFRIKMGSLIVCPESVWIGFSAKRAEADIKNNYYRLLLPSGLILHKLPGDEDFEKKYSVKFYNQCEEISKKSISEYNHIVIKYLDKKYGRKWRKEIRQDVIGLSK